VAETLCFDYHRMYGTKIKVVRIFNTYGPGMDPNDGRVVSNFIMQALKGEEITVYGDGTQTRSFCFVDDMVEALTRMMNQSSFIGPVNLGNPHEITINELLENISDTLDLSGARVVNMELPTDDPLRRRPDITVARNRLEWTPEVTLKEGLSITVDYFKGFI
jgi:UDP-glucuronate decarboxylase